MSKKKTEDLVTKDLEELQSKVGELENQLKRAVADYHNLEKRVQEGRSELSDWATTELITKLLPVVDHLFHAIEGAQMANENSGWLQGVRLAALELKKTLKEAGVEFIPDEQGEQADKFDPSLHEAIDVAEGENGKIIKIAEMGYKLNGKVVRPAKVVVGKAKEEIYG